MIWEVAYGTEGVSDGVPPAGIGSGRRRQAGGRGDPTARGVPTADDLVDRAFIREGPSQLWVTDITEHPT